MPLETHPEEVEDLPLQPVGILPESSQRGDPEVALGEPRLDPQTPVVGERVEMIDHFEPRLVAPVVNAGQVQEQSIILGLFFKEGRDGKQRILIDDNHIVPEREGGFLDLDRELELETLQDFFFLKLQAFLLKNLLR